MNEFRASCAYEINCGYLSLHPGSSHIKTCRENILKTYATRNALLQHEIDATEATSSTDVGISKHCQEYNNVNSLEYYL